MKRSIVLAFLFVPLLAMSSCGNSETAHNSDAEQIDIEKSEQIESGSQPIEKPETFDENNTRETEDNQEIAKEPAAEMKVEETKETAEAEENDEVFLLYAKYSEVLMQILTERTDPNGRVFDDAGQGGDFSGNAFAVIDIDGDGRDELIFNFNDTYMAAMQEIIYDYDEKNDILREELDAFYVMNTYYSNGYVKVGASHNHTCDPETRGVWPYSLYQYDPQTDSYSDIGYVQCWDELIFPTDYDGNVFPGELDTDEDNLLYSVNYYIDGTDDVECTYIDREEFEAWEQTIFPDEYKIDIEYHRMTEEEIEILQLY